MSVDPNDVEKELLDLINQYRDEQGKTALAFSREISDVAAPHTQGMFDRSRPVGHGGYEERFKQIPGKEHAELVGYNLRHATPVPGLLAKWTGEESTRQNVLGNFTEVGIAVVQDDKFCFGTVIFVRR
jgi:uncharacterized protein YkwD